MAFLHYTLKIIIVYPTQFPFYRREELRIRKEEEKIIEEILQQIKSLQKNNIPFTWTRCILETCLLGIPILLSIPVPKPLVLKPQPQPSSTQFKIQISPKG